MTPMCLRKCQVFGAVARTNLLTIELVLRNWLSVLFSFVFFPIYCLIALVVLLIVLAGIFPIYTKSISIRIWSWDREDFLLKAEEQKIKEQRCDARRTSTNMAAGESHLRRTLRDFVTPGVQGIASSIARPNVDANKLKLKLLSFPWCNNPSLEAPL